MSGKNIEYYTLLGAKAPHKYAIESFHSDEEEGFVAVAPELAGCSALDETEEEALSEVKVAISLWLDTAPGAEWPGAFAGDPCEDGNVARGVVMA